MSEDLADYEDFRMRYNKYDLEFMINNLKSFITSDYINKFYRKNASLALEVIKKLQEQFNILKEGEEKSTTFDMYCYNHNIFTKCEIMISFEYEEIITLRFYLNCLKTKDEYDERRRSRLVKELDEYIGYHKAWLDFRKITEAVDEL